MQYHSTVPKRQVATGTQLRIIEPPEHHKQLFQTSEIVTRALVCHMQRTPELSPERPTAARQPTIAFTPLFRPRMRVESSK
jgi:hypothetical protein